MSGYRLTVVLSQAQGKNPAKRALEECIAAALILESGLDVSIVPHLYDLHAEHTGRLFLESVRGDMVVLSWLYPRAAFWLLDRDGIKGHEGQSDLKPADHDEDEESEPAEPPKGIGAVDVPDRHIYCIDLRDAEDAPTYVAEIQRIAEECRQRRAAQQAEKAAGTAKMVEIGLYPRAEKPVAATAFAPEALLAQPQRRWYPVIDYGRCTNCMECIDFCLFGVYGVDKLDRILVEHQDNCKRGCPACSRVCPEHAIIFPEYKTPAIAGAPVGDVGSLKIDLTKLFGGGDAMKIAADERDRELVRDGRAAVGMTVGIPKRQSGKPQEPKDDLDALMDALDGADL